MKVRICVLAAALALTGCSSNGNSVDPPNPTQSENQTSDPTETEDPAPQPAQVIETEYFDAPITMSVYPVQSDGEHLLAQIELEYGAGGEGQPLDLNQVLTRKTAMPAKGVEDIRLVDRAAGKIYLAAKDQQDQVAGTTEGADLQLEPGGEPVTLFAYFATAASESVDLHVPYLGYVADLPVVSLESDGEFASPLSELGVGDQISSESFELARRSAGYDEFTNVQEEDDQVNWTISSDVLFDFGEYDLDKAAKDAIEDTIEEIKELAVEDGEIHLVGHTDDQGSADFNQDLSEKRAASVREVFESKFPGSYKITSEGKGKTQPAVEGTSEEARAANRRVEIKFTAKEDSSVVASEGDAVPDADVPTVSGNEQLEFELGVPGATDTVGVSVVSVSEVDDDYLVGVIEIELLEVAAEQISMTDLFAVGGMKLNLGRILPAYLQGSGTGLLTIATNKARLYPIEYVSGEASNGADEFDVLGDPRPLGVFAEGDRFTLSVVWPNPGTDTVTIDVPDRMRFTDVPVEK